MFSTFSLKGDDFLTLFVGWTTKPSKGESTIEEQLLLQEQSLPFER